MTVANYEFLKLVQSEKINSISDIQDWLSDSLQSLTQKSQKLEELGYLKKERNKEDPRKNILKITKKGIKVVGRVEKKLKLPVF